MEPYATVPLFLLEVLLEYLNYCILFPLVLLFRSFFFPKKTSKDCRRESLLNSTALVRIQASLIDGCSGTNKPDRASFFHSFF